MNNITPTKSFSLAPQDLAQAMQFAEIMSKSSIIPKDFANNPGNILVAVQWGMELGLQPMQAMQNIAVINGRPSLWGDAVIGLVRASPLCEYVIEEELEGKSVCRVKRRGEDEQIRIFTDDDAKKAGLLGKQGPWTQYPKRMRQMRARSWALRDVFPDVLRGMPIAEEVMDVEKDITPARPQKITPQAIAANKASDVTGPSPELLENIRFAADHGRAAFDRAWKAISGAERGSLRGELDDFKARCDKFDSMASAGAAAPSDAAQQSHDHADFLGEMDKAGGANHG